MLNKILKKENLTQFENKLKNRLEKNKLIFSNKIQLSTIKILNTINILKYDESFFDSCINCDDKISKIKLININGDLYCEKCYAEVFYQCDNCGEAIYRDNTNFLNDYEYCNDCYFELKQLEYKNHKIKNKLLKKLSKLKNYDLYKINFKIDKYLFSIDKHLFSKNPIYRLGSFGANYWLDIGSDKNDLIRAIDYNIGDKITNIYINNKELTRR